ncbi:hypothetical protein RND81_01G000400 [Saponaria officinalis]|uniref:DNA-directed RNA polymerase subunit n=1 Tax=Saponaria officinalis TaxID=3572 RepID=A0AAW1NCX9_SAPOF
MMKANEEIQYTKRPYLEDDEPRRIESIKFTMMSGTEISKVAEVQLFKGQYYDFQKKPIAHGLLDPKMGPPNKHGGLCATCHGSFEDCHGHYGYLPLALPVFNIGYIGAIMDILKCICKSCSCILLPEKVREMYLMKMRNLKQDALQKKALKKKIVELCSKNKTVMKCFRCGYVNGKVKKGSSILAIVHIRVKQEDDVVVRGAPDPCLINPRDALLLFNQMQDQDCELLSMTDRPEKLIITNLTVPPIVIRPSTFVDGGKSNEQDITLRLKTIIQANACLRQCMQDSANSLKILNEWDYLQVEVAQYINSEANVGSQYQQSSKPVKGILQRLKGKQGRFRGNLSGKRVEFTGRTVISPDPNLKITEIGVPQRMAAVLTYPEIVNDHNIEKLRQCVRNGPKKYPGAKLVVEHNGDKRELSFCNRKRTAEELKFGFRVHRHLEDGDIVLFNRQPSLHRMSMMCHRAKVMPWRTLRFNESVCNPYNADFDGDEMNIHVPQTEEARAEAFLLMGVQNNLCTPKDGSILVAATQDFLTSSFLITRKDTFYDRATFSLMCCYMGDGLDMIDLPTPALMKPIELWTGKQLLNVLLRPNAEVRVFINVMVKEKIFSKPEERTATCREETLCPNDGFVYFRNSELISGQLGKATLGNGSKVGLFSALAQDYNVHAAATCMNRLAKLSARCIGNHGFSIGIDDVRPGKLLNDRRKCIIMEGYKECDRLIQSYDAGKLSLIPGCDAAKTLEAKITENLNDIREKTGKVCMKELHWRNSPLIMSQCGSKGSPINISQMVACVGQQAVGGLRAPDGFIERSLPHFSRESKKPAAKGFVASSFYSGLTATEFFFHTMGGREGLVDTAVKTATTGYMARKLIKFLEDLGVQYDMSVRNSSGTIIQFLYGDDGMDPAQMEGAKGFPLNFERLRFKVEATCLAGRNKILSPSESIEHIDKQLSEAGITSEAFKGKLLEFFNKLANNKRSVSVQQLQVFLDACISRLRSKRIEAGTPIGLIGAQSIGEPGTQMTLKTFHFAGVASMNVTLGVPRIQEILDARKNISTPVITAKLEDDISMEIAEGIKGQIEKTTLDQVCKSIKLVMRREKVSVIVKLDMLKINSLRLCINAHIIGEKILNSLAKGKAKLNVKVHHHAKLEIFPGDDKSGTHFALHSLKNKLPKVVIKGVDTARRVIIAEEERNPGKLKLIIEGTGMRKVMGINGVKGCETESNHVLEVEQTLGIEAARTCIIKEINKVLESHSIDVDVRHLMLLADVMTYKGQVLGVNRFGMSKMKDSVLMLASFEMPAEHVFNASLNGKEEKIQGVSECVIMGTPMHLGTGMFKIRHRINSVPTFNYTSPNPIMS